ncbi:hypothetical protein CAPTEDRAFT_185061 [Capitella teleta]|uniref:Uncharacterized protein n=1 Tax=Capitella teleta TaxID=283909 RepID=R7TJ60_CAPTE|nr:hypothetical protein CAPTEDRAFT_185061 [Capitella teleta]|eukprot:ELT91145.1 hypothetical protein CAPTEDRAFT_185061 [Capitella teleta]
MASDEASVVDLRDQADIPSGASHRCSSRPSFPRRLMTGCQQCNADDIGLQSSLVAPIREVSGCALLCTPAPPPPLLPPPRFLLSHPLPVPGHRIPTCMSDYGDAFDATEQSHSIQLHNSRCGVKTCPWGCQWLTNGIVARALTTNWSADYLLGDSKGLYQ